MCKECKLECTRGGVRCTRRRVGVYERMCCVVLCCVALCCVVPTDAAVVA